MDTMEELFNEISSSLLNRMPFKSLFESFGNVALDSDEGLEYLMYAAYCSYFDRNITMANKILTILTNRSFNGDYDKWTWIEGGILLQIYLGQKDKEHLKNRILATLNDGDNESTNRINRKAFQRRANGFLLHKMEKKLLTDNTNMDFFKVIPYFCELIFVKTFKEEDSSDKQLLSKLSSIENRILSVISQYK